MNYFSIKKILIGITVVLMLIIYYKHPFRYFYKTPWEMFGLTKKDQSVKQNPVNIDTSSWKAFSNSDLGLTIKYPENFVFTKRLYAEPGVTQDIYATYVFSNGPVLPTGKERGSFEEASIKSQGRSTLSVEKAFVNSTNNPRDIIATGISEDAKNDVEKFAQEWSHIKDYSMQTTNKIQMLKSKPEECNLFNADLQGRGYCSYVYFKSKDGNYLFIRTFVNAYDETSAAIFDRMISTISIL